MELKNKVTIIGAGMVGSTAAYSLIAAAVCEEVALVDVNAQLVKSQVMDLQHSVSLWGYTKVKVGNYYDVADSKMVVITCGASQKPGMTRLDLVKTNSAIIKELLPLIFKQNPRVVVVMVTNPVDVLTYQAIKMFPKKKNQIFGSGTTLDSARLRLLLSEKLNVNPQSIHAYVVGEHGDSEVALWSTAEVGGMPVDKVKKLSAREKTRIFNAAKNAAYAIIAGKQSTYYGISSVIAQLAKAVLYDKKTVFPVSHIMAGEYGISSICLSLPAVVGRGGIVRKIIPTISARERAQLKRSAAQLKKVARLV